MIIVHGNISTLIQESDNGFLFSPPHVLSVILLHGTNIGYCYLCVCQLWSLWFVIFTLFFCVLLTLPCLKLVVQFVNYPSLFFCSFFYALLWYDITTGCFVLIAFVFIISFLYGCLLIPKIECGIWSFDCNIWLYEWHLFATYFFFCMILHDHNTGVVVLMLCEPDMWSGWYNAQWKISS